MEKTVVFREIPLEPHRTVDRDAFLERFDVCDPKARIEGVEQVTAGRGALAGFDYGKLLVRDRGVLVPGENGLLPESFQRAVACIRVTSRRMQVPEGCGRYVGAFNADGSRWRVFEYSAPESARRDEQTPSASRASPPPATAGSLAAALAQPASRESPAVASPGEPSAARSPGKR